MKKRRSKNSQREKKSSRLVQKDSDPSGKEKRKSEELTADEVMLNPEYLKKISEAQSDDDQLPCSGRPLTKEELEEIFRKRKMFGESVPEDGLSIKPWFSVKRIKVNGKMKFVPFIGIEGTF